MFASSYRGPSSERLPFDGTITERHYVALTACRRPGFPFHASPKTVKVFDEISEAVRFAEPLAQDARYFQVEVHVLARGWGFPDLLSRVWPEVAQ